MNEMVFVTRPTLPELDEFLPYLEAIWESKWLTNEGKFHKLLEKEFKPENMAHSYEQVYKKLLGQ